MTLDIVSVLPWLKRTWTEYKSGEYGKYGKLNLAVAMGEASDSIISELEELNALVAAQKAENAQLREAAFAYLSVSTFPASGAGNCRLCVERDGMHASDCKYGKAQIVLWAAIKKGGTR